MDNREKEQPAGCAEEAKGLERIRAVIHMDAVMSNMEAMHRNISPSARMIAVIKANAYGHGAAAIAGMLDDYEPVWGFGVATAEEALELRQKGVRKPILIIGLVFEDRLEELAENDIRITVSDTALAESYARKGKETGRPVRVHLAVDTGMTRIGFADREESLVPIRQIAAMEGLTIEGVFTHFARADETDPAPAVEQLKRFRKFCGLLDREVYPVLHHCSNSAGIIRLREANMDLVRAGISIYGIYPSDEVEKDPVRLVPVMELKSHVTYVKTIPEGTAVSYGGTFVASRQTRLATIPVGYADGYPRSLSGKGWVLIRGRKAPICGRVCMDQFMVDVTDIDGVVPGDEVTLMGRDKDAFLGVETLAELSGRFPYEFVCCISSRVPRVYE